MGLEPCTAVRSTRCRWGGLALIDVLLEDPAAARSARVEIWSGDHIFAGAALKLRRRSAEVSVFAPTESLSRRLAEVASRVIALPSVDRLGDAQRVTRASCIRGSDED